MKNVFVTLDDSVHQEIKMLSVKKGKPMKRLIEQIIKDYIAITKSA